MKPRSAIKTDRFAAETHRRKIDALGDPLCVRKTKGASAYLIN